MGALRPSRASALTLLRSCAPDVPPDILKKAVEVASAHAALRSIDIEGGRSLFEHAVRATELLSAFCQDESAIVASLLQHVLQDPLLSPRDLEKGFGAEVRVIVMRVHLLSHLSRAEWRRSADDMQAMLLSVASDVRVLLIVLSSVSASLGFLESFSPEHRRRLCRRALELFSPVAARLGIYALKYRLERDAFPECYPSDAELIGRQVELLHEEYGSFLHRTAMALRDHLAAQGIQADVVAREKQPFSIFQKMQTKSVTSLEKVHDFFAVRVIVPTQLACYTSLGFIHNLGTPISHRFKDYISFPKPNGYQSLHTCVLNLPHVPKNVMVEVQIRTHEMHQEAEFGVAAHWLYKEKGSQKPASDDDFRVTESLRRQAIASSNVRRGGDDSLSSIAPRAYVLTPRGDIVEIPERGTPLDFAFHVHSDLGLAFKAARVNGVAVPVNHPLENGDVVEIQTHPSPKPSLQWLQILLSSSAKTKLKNYFVARHGTTFLPAPHRAPSSAPAPRTPHAERTSRSTASLKAPQSVGIEGMESSMPHRFAKCCDPETVQAQQGPIIGVVNRSGVVVVHRDDCKMGQSAHSGRKLRMFWNTPSGSRRVPRR